MYRVILKILSDTEIYKGNFEVMKYCSQTGRRNHGRPLKIRLDTETGTGQVAQLHERYMMILKNQF